MLEWADPLWFLALPLALLPWWARRPRIAVASLAAVRTRPTLRTVCAWVPQVAITLGLVMVVLALARPQRVDRERIVESEGIDIMLVLDTSGSMEVEDYRLGGHRTSRIDVAKEVMVRFVEGRPDDRIGLVVFGEEAFTQVPLTLDHEALIAFLQHVQIGMAGDRATAIGDAVAVGGRRLKDLEAASKVMILLTDGRNNSGQVAPLQAAEASAALGVKIYTVGVGTDDGSGGGGIFGMLRGRQSDLDEPTLKAIAQLTDALYFRATDTKGLEKVYATIDELEPTTAESREFVHREERHGGLLWAGMAAFGLALLLGETVLRRLP